MKNKNIRSATAVPFISTGHFTRRPFLFIVVKNGSFEENEKKQQKEILPFSDIVVVIRGRGECHIQLHDCLDPLLTQWVREGWGRHGEMPHV